MKTYGNLKDLKEGLNKIFESKHDELDKYFEDKKKEIQDIYDKRLAEINSENEETLSEELESIKETYETAKKIEARNDYQAKKEELIAMVVDEIAKDASKIAKSKKYIDFVKKNLPPKATIYASSDSFKALIGHPVKVDKKIDGIRAQVDNIVYDFTISSLLSSNNERIKEEISKELFK